MKTDDDDYRWLLLAYEWSDELIALPHDYSELEHLLNEIMQQLPDQTKQILSYYKCGQPHVLRLLLLFGKPAIQMAQACPALLLLIADDQNYFTTNVLASLFQEKFKTVLQMLGFIGTKAAVRFLQKIHLN